MSVPVSSGSGSYKTLNRGIFSQSDKVLPIHPNGVISVEWIEMRRDIQEVHFSELCGYVAYNFSYEDIYQRYTVGELNAKRLEMSTSPTGYELAATFSYYSQIVAKGDPTFGLISNHYYRQPDRSYILYIESGFFTKGIFTENYIDEIGVFYPIPPNYLDLVTGYYLGRVIN